MRPSLSTKDPILQVAIPRFIKKTFDYLPLSSGTLDNLIGSRVLVPFGKQQLIGIVLNIVDHSQVDKSNLKSILQVIDNAPLLPEKLIELLKWAASYYHYPLGMVFNYAIPSYLRSNKTLAVDSDQFAINSTAELIKLNPAQLQVCHDVSQKFDQFQPFLLDGVTGSGKTAVYAELISRAIKNSKQCLILIPEINLSPQTVNYFEQVFKAPITVLHSQVSHKQRALAWMAAKDGSAPIVLGTRLAAFTPLKNPGLFIIDEEHDLSFKQNDKFKYSARDLLLKRAKLENCPIVLGSATPSLESWNNVKLGRYQHLILSSRAGNAKPPSFEIVDIRNKKLDSGLSTQLLAQMQEHLSAGQQVLLFLNRRGYAPVLYCQNCSWHQECTKCDANMVYHSVKKILRCHHCLAQLDIPTTCPKCANSELKVTGLGTQRIEEQIQQIFPNYNICRIDKDNVSTKKQLNAALSNILSQQSQILIGTQMLAKGHDFPELTLVAILDIDSALFSSDYRANEQMGQVIYQVAGRAGRGDKPGKVILQSSQPDSIYLNTLIENGYHAFLELLWHERQSADLPPFSYQVLVRAESKLSNTANSFLSKFKQQLLKYNGLYVAGPIPAPMERRHGYFRWQMLLQAKNRKTLHDTLQNTLTKLDLQKHANRLNWSIDVDPLDIY